MENATAIQFARRLGNCFGFRATPDAIVEVADLLTANFDQDHHAAEAVNQFMLRYPKWPGIQVLGQFLAEHSKAETEQDPVKAQLLRLAQLPTSAVDVTVALADLERLLCERGQDIDHIRRAVDHCLRTGDFLPTPYTLDQALTQTANPLAKAGCELCNGTGFKQVTPRHGKAAPFSDQEYKGVEPCECLKKIRGQ